MVTQMEIARRIGLDVSSVNKILNRRKGPVFRKETIKKVFKIARDLGFDFGRLKYVHRRRFQRTPVEIGADFCIYHKDGSLYDQGSATIRDISLGGACVSDVTLSRGSFPLEPFSVTLRPKNKPVDDVELPGRIVRLHLDEKGRFGISFTKLEPIAEKKLRRVAAG